MPDPPRLPKVYRPLGARMVSGVSAGVVIAVVAFLWLMLPADVQDDFGWFQRATLIAFFVAVILVLYAVFRTRVRVAEGGVSVVNGFRRHDLDWPEVVSISLSSHRPWASLDLADGTTLAVMALQTSDGPRSTRGAGEIATLLASHSRTDRDD